jgi:hypothetical protein
MSSVSRLKNPMRFSLGDRTVEFDYDVDVVEFKIRSSEGQLYVHWEPPICDTCLGKADEMHNWEDEDTAIHWTCPDHTPESVESEVYHVE